jgi:DNA-binding XRE family transcriptional regulator
VARAATGLTQTGVATSAGISQSFVSLIERGLRVPDIQTACTLAAAVGHEASLRLFPLDGVSLRDSGQLSMAAIIIDHANAVWHPGLEVPIAPGSRDRRAADLVLTGPREVLHIEIERHLVDLQAQLRAAQLKRAALAQRLEMSVRLVVALPGTRRARETVAAVGSVLRAALPASSASVWHAIRTGQELGSDGLLFVRRPTPSQTPTQSPDV